MTGSTTLTHATTGTTALTLAVDGKQSCLHHERHGRTAYHFQPAKNWMNDPNGPFYHNGIYHFFYQYNPHGPEWGTGKLSWGHSVSRDLVNWAFLGTALDPTSPFDADGCWSGSATTLPDGRAALVYTGRDTNTVQVQNVAFAKDPSDLLLREWSKLSCNPVIPQPADVRGNNFRDPTTAWLGRDGLWRLAVAAELDGGIGSTLIYRSADFVRWERNAAPLLATPDVAVWECPDLFPVAERGTDALDLGAYGTGVWHVLKLSKVADEDYYMVGRYDDEADTFTPAEEEAAVWRRVDHGHLFGAKTFFDARKKRRVMWAWVDETDSGRSQAKGWAGIMAFPRALWLDDAAGGGGKQQLVQWPVEEIETLRRGKPVILAGAEIAAGGMHEITGIDALQADVEVVFRIPNLDDAEKLDPKWLQDPQKCAQEYCATQQLGLGLGGGVGPFGLVVVASGDMREKTVIFFRVFQHHGTYKVLMCTDLARSSTKEGADKHVYAGFVDMDVKDRSISLRTLIDHSVIESFGGGGRVCMTARVYPEHVATGATTHMYVFNNGPEAVTVSKLEAWELAAARVNVEGDTLIGLQSPVVIPILSDE